MSTWVDNKLEQARQQLIKHGRSWTIYDEELTESQNDFISDAPDYLHTALEEVARLRAENEVLSEKLAAAERRAIDATWAAGYGQQGGL